MMPHGLFQPSPSCRVEMLGFESTTDRLAAHGWEIRISEPPSYKGLFEGRTLAMKHPKSAVIVFARQATGDLLSSALDRDGRAVFVVDKVVHDKCLVQELPTLKFRRIDASASMPEHLGEINPARRYILESLGLFRPWEDEVEEIIVDQASVSDLMDQIRKLQEPELAAIRERNRARDRRSQSVNDERVRAQVIAIAA